MATDVQGDLLNSPSAGPAVIRGSAIRVIGYVVGMFLSLVSVPLLIRHLDGDYWRYVTVISLVTIVQGVTDVGLSQIGVREYATRQGAAQARFMANLLGLRGVLTALGVLLGTAFAVVAGYGQIVVLGTLLAGTGMVLTVVQGTFGVPLASRLQLGWITALDLLRQVLTVGAVVALVVIRADLLAFLAITVPIAVIVLVATGFLVRGAMPLRPSLDRREWLTLIRAVLPFAAAAVVGTLYLRITVILMSLLASAHQNNYYAIAFTVVSVLVAIPALTVGSTLPVLAVAARDDDVRLAYMVGRLTDVTLIVGAGMGLALGVGAPFVVRVLSGSQNHTAAVVLQIMSVALLTQFVASAWQYGLLAMHEHRALLFVTGAGLATSALVTALLIPSLGAEGAAIGFAAAEFAMTVGSIVRLNAARPESTFFSRRVPLRVLMAVAIALLVVALPIEGSAGQTAIAMLLYFVVLLATRAIPRELSDAVLSRFRPAVDGR